MKRSVFNELLEGIYEVDKEGICLSINRAALEMFGYEEAEIVGKPIHEVCHFYQDQLELISEEDCLVMKAIGEEKEMSARIFAARKDGAMFPIFCNVALVKKRKAVVGAMVFCQPEREVSGMFDIAPAALYVVNYETGEMVMANQIFYDFLGYSKEEWEHMTLFNVLTPDSQSLFVERMEKIKGGKEVTMTPEFELINKFGKLIWVQLRFTFIKDRDGKISKALVAGHDITDRKRAEEALRISEKQHRLFTDNMVDLLFHMDNQGVFQYFAPNVTRLTGFEVEELLGKTAFDFVHPDDRGAAMDSFIHAIETGRGSVEARILHKEGNYAWMELIGKTFYTDNGEPQGIIVVGRDIVAKKLAQDELISLSRQLNDIIDFLPDATFAINKQGEVTTWNRAMEAMTGIKADQMLGKGDYEYALPFYGNRMPILIDLALHPDPEREREYRILHRRDNTLIAENLVPALGPGNIHLSATASVLRDSNGEVIGAIECIRNVTDRKEMEERLRRAEKMESLGVLAGGVAHDLNNVLGVLMGYAELLLREIPGESSFSKYANSIYQGAERAAAIIQDLLTMARRGVPVSEVININRTLGDFFKSPEFDRLKFAHSGVTFMNEQDPDLLNIKGSPIHIFKTIMNLLSNAAESIRGAGTVVISTENRYLDIPLPGYEDTKEGEYVVLTVSDTGSGISQKDLERIFEPFYTKKVMGRSGTGLGLALVWGTVKDHGGYIDVSSELGKGSNFTLYFPVTREAIPETDQKEISPEAFMGRGEKILVVDDVHGQRLLATTILEKLNYKVATVANGLEAVEYLKGNQVDLVILDMIMDPGIDGLETYRRILKINPRQKTIVVSGFSVTGRVEKIQELGAGEYVKKPYAIEALSSAVRRELDKK